MRITNCLIISSLILLITACQPQAELIEATPILPTIAASATFDTPVAQSRASLPPIFDVLTATPTPIPTVLPASPDERYQQQVERVARYLVERCNDKEITASIPLEALPILRTVSPDRQVIVFVVASERSDSEDRTLDVWAMNINGTNLRLLWNGGWISELKWLANTHQFVFNTGGTARERNYHDLHLIDTDTGEYRALISTGQRFDNELTGEAGGGIYPSWDGKYIATVTPTSVSLIDATGFNLQRGMLIYDMVVTYSEYPVFAHPIWSLDSSGVWIAVPPAENEAMIEVYFATVSGDLRQMGEIPLGSGGIARVPFLAASPTGEYVAYIRRNSSTSADLHIATLNGAEDMIYASDVWGEIEWLDATRFSFTSGGHRYVGEVGSEAQLLEADSNDCTPRS